jgi:uncharacterized 2Fe-2S/4Fe-4S cluster protein (DUF4445 family)
MQRLRLAAGQESLSGNLAALRELSLILRENNWKVNLVLRGDELIHCTPAACRPLAGLAVDVGSTKLACYLLDLETGRLLTARGTPNPQIMYGEDIMARLAFAQKGSLESRKLNEVLIGAIRQTAAEMCPRSEFRPLRSRMPVWWGIPPCKHSSSIYPVAHWPFHPSCRSRPIRFMCLPPSSAWKACPVWQYTPRR